MAQVQSTPLPWLPAELIMEILDQVRLNRYSAPSALAECALVCRAWTSFAQVRLFDNVILVGSQRLETFRSTLTDGTPHAKVLARMVKSLTLGPEHRYTTYRDGDFVIKSNLQVVGARCVSLLDVAETIALCPSLEELDWQGSIWHWISHEARLALQQAPPLRKLRLRSLSHTLVCELALLFPTLAVFEVDGTAPTLTPLPYASLRKPIFQLSEFRWREYETTLPTLQWLLESSSEAGSLATLDTAGVSGATPDDVFTYVASAHGDTLQALSLGPHSALDDLSDFKTLQEVAFGVYDADFGTLSTLPSSVRLIETEGDTLGPFVDAMKAGKLPHLNAVVVRVPVPWNHPIHLACTMRGVRLVELARAKRPGLSRAHTA